MRNETAVINMADQELPPDGGVEKYLPPKEAMGAVQEFSALVFDFFVKFAILLYSFVTGMFGMVMGAASATKKVADDHPVVTGMLAVGIAAMGTALIFTKFNRPASSKGNRPKQPSSPRKLKNGEGEEEVVTSSSEDENDEEHEGKARSRKRNIT